LGLHQYISHQSSKVYRLDNMEPYNNNKNQKPTALSDIQKKKIERIISAYKARILLLQAQQEQQKSRGL